MDESTHKSRKTHKRKILDQLRSARSVQLQWRTHTQALTQGASRQKAGVQARSRFNCWYWSASKHLASLKTFEAVSEAHKTMLQIDHHINNLILSDPMPSNFMKWFRSPKSYKNDQAAKAHSLLPKLVENSNLLLANIEALEKEVEELSEKEIKALPRMPVVLKSSKFRLIRNVNTCLY